MFLLFCFERKQGIGKFPDRNQVVIQGSSVVKAPSVLLCSVWRPYVGSTSDRGNAGSDKQLR